MKKMNRVLLSLLIVITVISLFFNIFFVKKHNLSENFSYKIVDLLNLFEESPIRPNFTVKDNITAAYYLINDSVIELNQSAEYNGENIPNKLIIKTGVYKCFGRNYHLEREGLYRFISLGKINVQRIVYQNDLEALLSALSWIITHGNSDNQKRNSELTDKAKYSKLYITCGRISNWVRYLLKNLNIKSRLVAGLNIDNRNGYNDGHKLIEVWRNDLNKWVLYDLDNNAYFMPVNGNTPFSLIEFSRSLGNSSYRKVSLSSDTRTDISGFKNSDGYNYGFIAEHIETNLHDWYVRVMQVPMIGMDSEKVFYFTGKDNKEKVEAISAKYPYKYINEDEFQKKFYAK